MLSLCFPLASLPQLLSPRHLLPPSSHLPALLISDICVPPLHLQSFFTVLRPNWAPLTHPGSLLFLPVHSSFRKQSLTDRTVYRILEPKTCIGCLHCSDLSSVASLPGEAVGPSREQSVFSFPGSPSPAASAQCRDFNGVRSVSLGVSQPTVPYHKEVANSLHRSPV